MAGALSMFSYLILLNLGGSVSPFSGWGTEAAWRTLRCLPSLQPLPVSESRGREGHVGSTEEATARQIEGVWFHLFGRSKWEGLQEGVGGLCMWRGRLPSGNLMSVLGHRDSPLPLHR